MATIDSYVQLLLQGLVDCYSLYGTTDVVTAGYRHLQYTTARSGNIFVQLPLEFYVCTENTSVLTAMIVLAATHCSPSTAAVVEVQIPDT